MGSGDHRWHGVDQSGKPAIEKSVPVKAVQLKKEGGERLVALSPFFCWAAGGKNRTNRTNRTYWYEGTSLR